MSTEAQVPAVTPPQPILGLVMLLATTASGLDGAGLVVSRIIFLFFSLAVLVVQPLRGMNALYGEIKSSTIDMMVLTRLSARSDLRAGSDTTLLTFREGQFRHSRLRLVLKPVSP